MPDAHNKNNSIFPTYIETCNYRLGDRLYLVPTIDGTQTFPIGTRTNFMGKTITYQAITTAREYPFRIRAKIDNPRDPNIAGSIGTDWAVDEPGAIVEEGSNANGRYTLYAGSDIKMKMYKSPISSHPITMIYPLLLADHVTNSSKSVIASADQPSDLAYVAQNHLSQTRLDIPGASGATAFLLVESYWY